MSLKSFFQDYGPYLNIALDRFGISRDGDDQDTFTEAKYFIQRLRENLGDLQEDSLEKIRQFGTPNEQAFAALALYHSDWRHQEQLIASIQDMPNMTQLAIILEMAEKRLEAAFPYLCKFLTESLALDELNNQGHIFPFPDGWRLEIPRKLVQYRNRRAIPYLRGALRRVLELEEQLFAQGKEVDNTYQLFLLFALGRYRMWGVLTGLQVGENMWQKQVVLLCLGHLYGSFEPTRIFRWTENPDLYRKLERSLRIFFGFTSQESTEALSCFEADLSWMSFHGYLATLPNWG